MRPSVILRTTSLICLALALSGCGLTNGACGSDNAKDQVSKAIKDEIDKLVPGKISAETPQPPQNPLSQPMANGGFTNGATANGPATNGMGGNPILANPAGQPVMIPPPPAPSVPHGAIRRLIDAIAITIDDIRTNGSVGGKSACSASVSLRFPVAVLNTADAERHEANLSALSELADAGEIDAKGDTYVAQVNYNIQETDDKSKLFAEVEKFNKLYDFAAEVVTANLVKPVVDQTEQANKSIQAAASAAQTELKTANLNAAKTDLQLAVQTINAVWNAIDPQVRHRLLPLQKAWWQQAVAQCKVDAAGASTDPMEVAATEAECQAKANQDRATWLNQFRTPQGASPDQGTDQGPANPAL